MILSLFCGCGGLDLGFEQAGYSTSLAFDLREDAVASWNENREFPARARTGDVRLLSLEALDAQFGRVFEPAAVIGGPPCQSFTQANHRRCDTDARSDLIQEFFSISLRLHSERKPLRFIVMENVCEVETARSGRLLSDEVKRLESFGFSVFKLQLNAVDYGVPQRRKRLFLVALNQKFANVKAFADPPVHPVRLTVRDAIGDLPAPTFFSMAGANTKHPHHANHWCMTPKSPRFADGSLIEGDWVKRSFKTLAWDQPSIAVSYGHREVHVHPSGTRRLSIYEAMKLQGFPDSYNLNGTFSSQVDQVSEAVPPPLAKAVAEAISRVVYGVPPTPDPKMPSNEASCSSAVAA